MESITLYTEEIDDLKEATEELFEQLGDFRFRKNSLGILHFEEDTEYGELYELLSARLDFPIVGCTAMALFLGEQGYRGVGIAMMIMTADDCEFSADMTGELDVDNYKDEIAKTYRELRAKLPSEPKLVITYGGVALNQHNVAGDDVLAAIEACGKGIPIFGALASDSFTFEKLGVNFNGRTTRNGQIIVLVSGNIAPRFVTNNSVDNRSRSSYLVTESRSNQLMKLEDVTFVEMLKRENMAVDKENVIADYILSPFVLKIHRPNGDDIEIARSLSVLNLEEGSGTFLGAMPEGATLSIGLINRADVQKSVDKTFEKVFEFLRQPDNPYHTLICCSCGARFFALAGNTAAEAETYAGKLPKGVSLLGIYGNGEICPIIGNKSGALYNSFHNFTFTIMMI
ncbi:MAG: FIST C-terminal domain-containing protein [Schwartzia sp.]|nr:FIST C-terminal domain-containing protein [Schwartzia sp. (in: firmicutes)]